MLTPDIITLFAHVALGTLAVVVGAIALGARKGRKVHVNAGRVFVLSMGLASLLGAVLGAIKYETYWITFHAGILGATLVTSGVLAVRIRNNNLERQRIELGQIGQRFGQSGRFVQSRDDDRKRHGPDLTHTRDRETHVFLNQPDRPDYAELSAPARD